MFLGHSKVTRYSNLKQHYSQTNRREKCLLEALLRRLTLLGPHQHVDAVDVSAGSQQFLDYLFTDEARAAGDEHATTGIELADQHLPVRCVCL